MKHALWPLSLLAASCFALCSCSSDTNKDTATHPHTTSSGGATHSMPPGNGSNDASATRDASASAQDSGPMQAGSASQGCGIPTDILGNTPTLQQVAVNLNDGGNQDRSYYLRLPPTYDNTRPYTLILLGPGCGADGRSVVPIQTASGEDAIIVGLNGADQCFHTGSGANSPDVAYFDATLADLEAKYCIDTHKVFMAGFSSGAWLTYLIGCLRGDELRGIGTMAGGFTDSAQGQCVGHVAAMIMADTADPANPIVNPDPVSQIDEGPGIARDMFAASNGCSTQSNPWDPEFPDCVINQGCDPRYPVVWCKTMGKGHTDQIPMSTVGLWRFWSSLP